MKLTYCIFVILIMLFSCRNDMRLKLNQKNQNDLIYSTECLDKDSSILYPPGFIVRDSFQKLLTKSIVEGDVESYGILSNNTMIMGKTKEFFLYYLFMANKHQNSHACFEVYNLITNSKIMNPTQELGALDSTSKKIALFYLLKSYELGENIARSTLLNIYKKEQNIPKSSNIIPN